MGKCLVINKELALKAMREGLNRYFSDEARSVFCFDDIDLISTDEETKICPGDVITEWQLEIPERRN